MLSSVPLGLLLGIGAVAALVILFAGLRMTDLADRIADRTGLGEAVVHDLRREVFAKLQRMPMRFYDRTKVGRIISRMTSDIEAMRVGGQDVLFISASQLGHVVMASAVTLTR